MAASDAFYLELAQDAKDIIAELGASFEIVSDGGYDPVTLQVSAGPPRTVNGVVADQKTAMSIAGGAEIKWVSDKILILDADAAPQPNESVFVGGVWHSLSAVKELKPAEITVIYMLDLSK